ncbi:uncharacterized protein N0V89_009474 [Didymosphaeria variabile]|uniref:Major facilitator superfamily (MFS) profile domain-containing protein n=1 Tax=Didymosphaeria variabile TaxID=1932322 RepID=A0A9W9C6K9_9PLEO|nr:uncharacterized protein N0V89_009474 [Didymosphaeria variabile]KAJ4348102.1 hypothetical protein N0V89_009474 [Didymosphaeria variabile]
MPSLSKLRPTFRRTATEDVTVAPESIEVTEQPKHDEVEAQVEPDDIAEWKAQQPNEDAQRGVRMVEGITLTWSKGSLIWIFINMWLLYFVNGFQSSILSNLTPYVTSEWEEHSLLTVISIISSCMSAATYIPMAKILDIWGRAEGFALMIGFATLGLVLMACASTLAIFCAAQVFYSIGFAGVIYSIDVITSDASHLRNRGLAFAFTSSPYIIIAFAGPKASEGFYENIGWRWGFGAFSIILPCVALPMFIVLKLNLRKAKREGRVIKRETQRTMLQSIWHYTKELDALGCFLFVAGLVVFLLPFSLADSAPNGWSSGYIIAMIVVGFIILIMFGCWEAFLAPYPFLTANLLMNRTVAGACLLSFNYQIAYYCWASYFSSFLQVVNDLSISEAGYVTSTFDVVSGVLLLGVGFLIRRFGYFKYLLWIGVPLYIFAQGLMIYFRRPNSYIGYLVMCQIFISVGGSVMIICQQLAVLAAADHQHVAAVLALLNVIGTIGGAVGNTISGAIWTNTFSQALTRYLPEDAQASLEDIYGSLDVQLSYAWGSPARIGIQQAYGYSQQKMLIAGTAIMSLSLVWVFMIRNINVKNIEQVKGVLF